MLFQDEACSNPSQSNSIELKETNIVFNTNYPVLNQTVYLCAKTSTAKASKAISFHICGHELVTINKSAGELIVFDEKLSSNSSAVKTIEVSEMIKHFKTSNALC